VTRPSEAQRKARLQYAADFGWSVLTEGHWYRMVDGERLDYWPSTSRWKYRGVYHRGRLPTIIRETLH
jgi:hypothetical protein